MKIISVNIERRKHLEKITELIKVEKPDVVFFQEICQRDLAFFEKLIGGTGYYVPMVFKEKVNDYQGIGVVSKLPATHQAKLLVAREDEMQKQIKSSGTGSYQPADYHVLFTTVNNTDGKIYNFASTHLPVTPVGSVTDYQLETIDRVLNLLSVYEDMVLVGDTNAPRGREAFTKLSEHFADNIPEEYYSSLDNELHRAAPLEFMVDVLFTSKEYSVKNTRLVCGVSDHCAVCAEVFKL